VSAVSWEGASDSLPAFAEDWLALQVHLVAALLGLPGWATEQSVDRIQHKTVIDHRFEHDKLDTRSLALPHNISARL